ncbi:MAG: acyltransferase family protein [Methyloprofundus sp.]|nr:acyltransferase family protein [Methyloprofundus sp.]
MPASLQKLLKPNKSPLFPFIDGLRAISIIWIIAMHTLWMFGYFLDKQAFIEFSTRTELGPFFQGHLAVDTFFVISGFLIGYYLFSEYRQKQTLQLQRFYLRRALRLLPAYFAVMLLVAMAAPINLHNIWANIFYINNFLPVTEQFMPWTWSLAIEEQFYILLPCLILVIGRSKHTLFILTLIFLMSFIVRFAISYYNQLQLPLALHEVIDQQQMFHYFDVIYDKSYSRYGGLIVGVIVAYLSVYTQAVTFLKTHHGIRLGLWWLSLLLLALYISTPINEIKAGVLESAYIIALVRNVFSLAIGYSILYSLCVERQSWLINCLSSRFWYPFAQLSYSAYLLHLIVITFCAQYLYPDMHLSFIALLGLILLMLVVTFSTALLIYLSIEKPMIELRNKRFSRFS